MSVEGQTDGDPHEGTRAALDDEARERFARMVTPRTLGVLVLNLDDQALHGWAASASARPWVNAKMFATMLRDVADQYDPVIPVTFTNQDVPPDDAPGPATQGGGPDNP